MLAFTVSGTGPPLLLVHAGIADSRMWAPQLPALTPHFTVVTCDLRGYGVSPQPEEAFAHHEDLREVLDHLGIESTRLLGLSMGASVSMDFTLTFPELVEQLVLCATLGPPPFSETLVEWFTRAEATYLAEGLEALNEVELQIWVDGPHRSAAQVDPDIRALVAAMNLPLLAAEERGTMEPSGIDPPADARLSEIAVPTLVVAGSIDQPDVVDYAYRLAAGIPNSRLEIVPGVAHMINLEAVSRFNELVVGFLTGESERIDQHDGASA